jgi:2-iminoacetate synthase
MTFKEFLLDYASLDTKEIDNKLIEKEINNIPKENVRRIFKERLVKIDEGDRDFRF